MTVSVLIVDDSGFFRRRLSEMISACPGLKVVGTASNGREAIDKVRELKPDVITMDYEMPVMDGISAIQAIMAEQPTPVLMFSSLTYEGARVTLQALEAGAVDYLPKNFEEISRNSTELRDKLSERLLEIARGARRSALANAGRQSRPSAPDPQPASRSRPTAHDFSVVVIGTSTGGPIALQRVLTQLPVTFPLPLVVLQHMPASFTPAFAERLDSLCRIQVRQAVDGDTLRPGLALLAPGGKQLMIVKGGRVKVLPGDERLNYKPCIDVTFGSAANVFRDRVLALVLTGMGADGCEGARLLKAARSTVWAQDEASSVIYGMPMAIAKAGLADEIMPLATLGTRLAGLVR